ARSSELVALASIQEHGQNDRAKAFDTLARALTEDPADPSLQDHLERLAGELGAWGRLYELFLERAQQTVDSSQASELLRRAGRIGEEALQDVPRAIEAYRLAASHDDDAS